MSGVSAPAGPPPSPRGRLRWGAIAIGAAVDVAGTRVSSTLISMAVGVGVVMARSQNSPDLSATQAVIQNALQRGWVFALSIGIGLLWSVAGGYLAGYLAKTRFLLNTAVTGACSASFGLLSQGMSAVLATPGWTLLLTAITVPAAMLGGWLAWLSFGRQPHSGTG